MVFLSTCQVLLGYPLTRSVFAFGSRLLTQKLLIEEIVVGLWIVLPASLIVSFFTKRLATLGWGKPNFIRRDVWTTILITVVGDLFLELLLPSLQCLPTEHPWDLSVPVATTSESPRLSTKSYLGWLQRTWGYGCLDEIDQTELLSTDAVGTLLTVRLIFMCLGVYLGEALCPVALTGGIACGKSTVCKLLVNVPQQQQQTQANPSRRNTRKNQPKSKKGKATVSSAAEQAQASSTTFDDEGSFLIVDTDKIAHEIMLPPSMLSSGSKLIGSEDDDDGYDDDDTDDEDDLLLDPSRLSAGSTKQRVVRRSPYTVSANDSVYHTVLNTFGDESDNYRNILSANNLIDRDKLGAMVFSDHNLRRQLNRITHPRIFVVMMKQILHGVFGSSLDIVCADVPLLFESMGKLRYMFALVIVVACSKETQFQRLKQRNPELTPTQCWERINSQLPIDQKVAMADIVIWNDGDVNSLTQEVELVRRDVMGRMFGIGMSLMQMLLLVGGSLSLAVSSKLFSSWSA